MSTDLIVRGSNLSDAWARTVVAVAGQPGHKAFHVITRISDPTREDARIREMADGILLDRGLSPVVSVANTLFPHRLAQSTQDPNELGERYIRLLPRLKRLDCENRRGTYFERLVDYQSAAGPINQLAELIRRLEIEIGVRDHSTTGAKSARYEVPLDQPASSVQVSDAGRDTNPIGFPCLTLLSFQLDHDRLHAVAHYRSHYLFQRVYGNYLAVGQLLGYVCEQTGLEPGQVTSVAGYAQVDHHRTGSVKVLEEYLSSDQLL